MQKNQGCGKRMQGTKDKYCIDSDSRRLSKNFKKILNKKKIIYKKRKILSQKEYEKKVMWGQSWTKKNMKKINMRQILIQKEDIKKRNEENPEPK